MAAKSIVEIDVQDEKFQSFLEKFNEYQKALGELPEQWRGAVHGLGETVKETERVRDGTEAITEAFHNGVAAIASVNDGLDRLNTNLEKATKIQSEFNKKSSGARGFLSKASKDAKTLAGHIKSATASLLSWGTVLGVFSGLAGAGGLWGLNRLAGNASAQRFSALGLGTTAGGLNASAVNFQKALGNPISTLGAIRDAQLDLSKRWQFQAMGIANPDQDPAELLPQMIRSARDIFVRNGSTQQGAEAYGLTNYFTLDDLNRFKNMSDAEIDAMAKQAQKDTQRLQLTDQQLRQWQDFNIQLDRSKASIGNTFIRGLAPLAPGLNKLSDAFSSAIDTILKSPELGKWIDRVSEGIQRFGNYLASPEFSKDVEAFMSGVGRLARIIGKVIGWIAGKTSLSVDDVKSGSSILSNEPVVDKSSGQSYIPGSESDPRVWGWLKSAKRVSGVTPSAYDEYFEEAARKYNLDPKLLKSVAGAESSWNPNAVGPKTPQGRAQGLMQVMPMNFLPGENPFDPRDNIMAGARVMAWAKSKAGDDVEEMLRWYNGGKNRGSRENREYPGRVREKYIAMYGAEMPGISRTPMALPSVQQNTGKTDQLLQQILDNQKRSSTQGVVVYNNTGGNAVVSSTQLGGFG
ncbi:lytic transglycosylase domain-containing protein [Cronobacter sp. EKM101R]|uniref:lytic transglycosylase domain-containing protein n=1 Tax=Cronobacter TaxID=413496 RepID=UPI0013ED4D68|nr:MULTISPECIES: lytic transglycosylase domain-containing protein [Cronobacter]KAF6596207.1 lytic transglycosylase domain-containing protein [Cronobacter sp. EKM101R]KAF6599034.1 lytic transglycosylase domain-containing protein [Cronobacter sp. EKM102R]MDK1204199.1 lytic transglycosylase domain-containing protein [Cronobacter turicensis]MDK1214256.1 lytic transglycosylase domain-containing protein [Cronobacter turicensis]MDK1233306.1 lytic transglycosylase domain-containing protein [Cronobacte